MYLSTIGAYDRLFTILSQDMLSYRIGPVQRIGLNGEQLRYNPSLDTSPVRHKLIEMLS